MQRPPFSQPGTYGGTSTGAQQQMGYGQPRPGMPMQTSQPPGKFASMVEEIDKYSNATPSSHVSYLSLNFTDLQMLFMLFIVLARLLT